MTVDDEKEGVLFEPEGESTLPMVSSETEQDDFGPIIPGQPIRTLSIGEKRIRSMVERLRGYVKMEPFQQYLPYSVIPTKLCRTSPFFIINKKDPEYSHRPYLRDYLVTETSWGRLTVSGPKLSVFDEDILLGLLYYVNLTNRDKESQRLKVPSNTYTGKVRPILKLMGVSNPSVRDYERLRGSLKMLYEDSFCYSDTRGKNIGELHFRMFDRLYYERPKDKKKGEGVTFIHVELNKEFLELAGGSLAGTFIDMAERAKLKRQTSKALHRFLRSQKPGVLRLHLNTLRDALNLNPDLTPKSAKRELKRAVNEMIRVGLLRSGSGFTAENNCILIKPGAKVEEEPEQKQVGKQVAKMIGSLADAKTLSRDSDHAARVRKQAKYLNVAGEISRRTGRPFEEVLMELVEKDPS